jgi:alpha-D-xyloside xylohydrolase
MPYIYAQAKASSERGFPMMRTLFFEYPDDPTSWLVEDEYFLGGDLLVAPLFDDADHRRVYLPPGVWIDYQTGRVYPGATWHDIRAGTSPIVVLVRDGAVVPHIAVAQHTAAMNWHDVELRVFQAPGATNDRVLTGLFALPDSPLQQLELRAAGGGYTLTRDPTAGKVRWRVTAPPTAR